MKRTQQLPGQSIVVHLSLSDTYHRKILIALYSFTDVPSRISFHGPPTLRKMVEMSR